MAAIQYTGDELWQRVDRAVEKVKDRLRRAAQAFEAAGVPYAVVGGNAVQVWVAQVDEAAVRNTRDVDFLLRRSDLPAAKEALERAGFVYRHSASVTMFLDGPTASVRDAVHIVFANEKGRPGDFAPAPDVTESASMKDFRAITLEALVRMKLTSFRDKDRTHLRDMLELGLINEGWLPSLPAELAARLQGLIDTPEG